MSDVTKTASASDSLPADAHGSRLAQIKAMFLTSGATVTTVGLNVVRTKIVAELLGPSGTAISSQLSNIFGVTGIVATLGVPAAVVQRIAAADGRDLCENSRRTVATASRLFVILSFGVCVAQLIATPLLLHLLGGIEHGRILLAIVAIAVPLSAASSLATATLNGRQRTRETVTSGVAGALLAAAVSFPLTWELGIRGAVAAIVSVSVGSMVYAFMSLRRCAPDLWAALVRPGRLSARGELRSLVRFGIPSVLAGVVPMLAQLVARTIVVSRAGPDAAGLFQSAMAFSQQYAGLFLGSIGVYLMPALSATRTPEGLSQEAERSLLLLLELGTPIILIAIAAHDIVLPLAYSRRFLGAGVQLEIQLAADIAKIASWHFAIALVARGEVKAFLFVEILASATLVGCMAIFIRISPRLAGGFAFAGMYGVYLPVTYFLARWRCGLRITGRGWRAITMSFCATGAGLGLSLAFGRIARGAVGILALLVLLFFLRRLAGSGALQATPLRRLFKGKS